LIIKGHRQVVLVLLIGGIFDGETLEDRRLRLLGPGQLGVVLNGVELLNVVLHEVPPPLQPLAQEDILRLDLVCLLVIQ